MLAVDACSGSMVMREITPPPQRKRDPLRLQHFQSYQDKAQSFSFNFDSAAGSFFVDPTLKGCFLKKWRIT